MVLPLVLSYGHYLCSKWKVINKKSAFIVEKNLSKIYLLKWLKNTNGMSFREKGCLLMGFLTHRRVLKISKDSEQQKWEN